MFEKAVTLEHEMASIVIVGNFNPTIFHPSWFLANQLISSEDAESTEIQVIAPVISAMFLGKWLNLSVQEEKFTAICKEPQNFKPMRDFVQGIFILLEHTPVKAMGINFEKILSLRNQEDRDSRINNLYNQAQWSNILGDPVFNNIDISRGSKKEDLLRVSVLPTDSVTFGIHVKFNYHKELENMAPINIIELLNMEWETCYQESISITEKITRG